MIPRPPLQTELRGARGLWEPPPNAESAKPKMRLVAFRPLVKNSLRGFATIELPIGLRISDIPVCISNGRAWAALPSKPQIDQDGRHRRDANGKPAYAPILEWRDKDLKDRFSAAVTELVRAAHPAALEADSGPQQSRTPAPRPGHAHPRHGLSRAPAPDLRADRVDDLYGDIIP